MAKTAALTLDTLQEIRATAREADADPWREPVIGFGLADQDRADFPVDVLPPVVADMVRAVSETRGVGFDMAAPVALGCMSIACRNHASVEVKPGHVEGGNLFYTVFSPPATAKSPVAKVLAAPILEYQNRLLDAHAAAEKARTAMRAAIQAEARGIEDAIRAAGRKSQTQEVEKLRNALAEALKKMPPDVPPPTLLTGNATSEALARCLADNGGAVGVFDSDGRGTMQVWFGRYTSGGTDEGVLLRGHAGDAMRVDRAGKAPLRVEHPVLAILVLTQTDMLAALGRSPDLRHSGLLSRFLYALPVPGDGAYALGDVPEAVAGAWGLLLNRLLRIGTRQNPDGSTGPHILRMTRDAFETWRGFHDETTREARAVDSGRMLASWLAKLPGHCARLALLMRLARDVSIVAPVEAVDVEAAIRISKFFRCHAECAEQAMGGDEHVERAERVWRWINERRRYLEGLRAGEGLRDLEAVTARDLLRMNVAGLSRSSDAQAALEELESRRFVRRLVIETGRRGRRRNDAFHIRPAFNSVGNLSAICRVAD